MRHCLTPFFSSTLRIIPEEGSQVVLLEVPVQAHERVQGRAEEDIGMPVEGVKDGVLIRESCGRKGEIGVWSVEGDDARKVKLEKKSEERKECVTLFGSPSWRWHTQCAFERWLWATVYLSRRGTWLWLLRHCAWWLSGLLGKRREG